MFWLKQDFTITGKPLENEEWHAGVPFNFSVLTKMTLQRHVIPSAQNLTFGETGRYVDETKFRDACLIYLIIITFNLRTQMPVAKKYRLN